MLHDAKRKESKDEVIAEKDISVHETEISVTVIPVKERKEEAVSTSKKHKAKLKSLQAGVKYHNTYSTQKQSLMMKERQVFLETN